MILRKNSVSLFAILLALIVGLAVAACGSGAPPTSTPDIPATVEAAVQQAIPTPTPDIQAMVDAGVQEALAALSTATPAPLPTPIPIPEPAATPTPTPTAVPTPMPTSTPLPTPTSTPTSTPLPSPTPTPDLATIVEQVKAGVVRIDTLSANGTGFVFETTPDGGVLLLTNYHVIDDAWTITVLVNDSDQYVATVVGFDEYRDLAVLRICCGDFHQLDMAAPSQAKAGTEVMAIGYPLDIAGTSTVTSGIVSAYRYDDRYQSWVVQTDAPINAGSSGGPLISADGKVLGINTYVIRGDYRVSAEGLGFAISQQSINEVLSDLKQGARYQLPTPTPTLTPTPTRIPTPTPVRWQTYTNSTYRYTIEVPRDWKIDDSDKSFVSFESPDQVANATVEYFNWPTDLEAWADELIEFYRNDSIYAFEVFTRDIKMRYDSLIGAGHIFLGTKPSGPYCLQTVGILLYTLVTRSYAVTSVVCAQDADQYLSIKQTIIKSFSLN